MERPDDRFRIGSVTKVFVATVALQLVAERRLSLDAKVRQYFPDPPESIDAVTVGQLLNHTSGIPNEVGYPDLSTPEKVLAHRYDRWTPEQLRELIPATEPKFTPWYEAGVPGHQLPARHDDHREGRRP